MQKILGAAALAALLGGCARLPAPAAMPAPAPVAAVAPVAPPLGAGIEFLDLTDEFAAFWDSSNQLAPAARAAAFKAFFEPLIPGFYNREKAGPRDYSEVINRALDQYPDKRAGIAAVSAKFRSMAEPARVSFEAEFGPMGTLPPIVLLHSLGEFDGGVRTLNGQRTLMFGADVIARIHSGHDVQPFFHHELFHVFHKRSFEDCDAVWCGLWGEGLAVYVAERLNPGATDAQLLLTTPVPLRAAIDANRHEAMCAVLGRLESTSSEDIRGLFSSGRISDALPPRSGYYIGYLAAAEIGKTHNLKQLASLGPGQARPLIEASLRRLAGTHGCTGERG